MPKSEIQRLKPNKHCGWEFTQTCMPSMHACRRIYHIKTFVQIDIGCLYMIWFNTLFHKGKHLTAGLQRWASCFLRCANKTVCPVNPGKYISYSKSREKLRRLRKHKDWIARWHTILKLEKWGRSSFERCMQKIIENPAQSIYERLKTSRQRWETQDARSVTII